MNNAFAYCDKKEKWRIKAALLAACKKKRCKKRYSVYQELQTLQPKLLTV